MELHPLVVLLIGIIVVFVLIIQMKINAFIALITAATTVGVLSSKVPFSAVMGEVATIFGTVCGSIGIVIALAALIGQCLMESGAADKIVRVFVRALGEKNSTLSLLTSGYVLSVPVFFDTVSTPKPGQEGMSWLRRVLTTEYTIYAAFIGSTFVTMATHGIDQDTVQRMLTAKNKRQSAFATIMSGLVDLPVVCAFVFIGLLLHCFFTAYPAADLPKEGREVFPYFILHEMSPGLRGLVIAGILARSMAL